MKAEIPESAALKLLAQEERAEEENIDGGEEPGGHGTISSSALLRGSTFAVEASVLVESLGVSPPASFSEILGGKESA